MAILSETGHAEAIRATERLHFAQQSYDYAKEEYEQLLKMYEADDLTEGEIILRGQKAVLRASESLRLSKMKSIESLKSIYQKNLIK